MIMRGIVKCIVLLPLCCLLSNKALAQDVKETPAYKNEKAVYEMGLKFGDVNIARSALYNLMVLDPKDISLLDSLAFMYYDYQRYTSCILVCLDLLKRNPNHLPALEMSAISYENLGLKDKALENYESIYLKENSMFTLYKVAALQLELSRYVESMTNVDILLKNKETQDAKISMNTNEGPQEISMRAAIFNLKGLIESQQNNKEAAKASFNEALSLQPDFALAKNNLQDLDK